MKRGHKDGGQDSPPPKKHSHGSKTESQVVKMKNPEEDLRKLIKTIDPSIAIDTQKNSGGIDSRIESISKMTKKLSKVVKNRNFQDNTKENNVNKELINCPTNKTNNQENPSQEKPNPDQTKTITTLQAKPTKEPKITKKTKTNYVPLNLDQIFSEPFPKFYLMKVSRNENRSLNPFAVIDNIAQKIGGKPKQFTGFNSTSFTIEVSTVLQAEKLGNSLTINDCTYDVIPHPYFNKTRGLNYVEDVKINDIIEFKEYLQNRYENLHEITEAPFIKSRNIGTQVFIVEFNQDHLPHSLYIPGERTDGRIYKFRNKPLLCNKCLQYGHPQKH